MRFAIIGGSGLYQLTEEAKTVRVETRFGPAELFRSQAGGRELFFLPRHGPAHQLPPHLINFRANIAALREVGVDHALATASVGSLNERMQPGELVILDQFIDFTKSRPFTMFDQPGDPVVHLDMSQPYCPELRANLLQAGNAAGGRLHPAGTYVCAEGPRFETPAEIAMFRRMGADVVGMTGLPEVVLAREAGICYSAVAVITNWAAGIAGGTLDHREVVARMQEQVELVRSIMLQAIALHDEKPCDCLAAMTRAR